MTVNVVGYKACDFKDKDGKQVQGVSLKCVVDSSDLDLVGKDITKIWLPKSLIDEVGYVPGINNNVNLKYDWDGKKAVLIGYELV